MVKIYFIGNCSVNTSTKNRKCTCGQGWSGDYCRRKVCYDGYCKHNSINYTKENNVNINHQMILNVNVGKNILVNSVKRKFANKTLAMVMVILLVNAGQCSHATGKKVCVCDPGYALPLCAQKSCDNYLGCNHGSRFSNRSMYI